MSRFNLSALRGLVRQILFSEINPVVELGKNQILQAEDLPELPPELDPRSHPLDEEKISQASAMAFLVSIIREGKRFFVPMFLFNWGNVAATLLGPILVNRLIVLVSHGLEDDASFYKAIAFAVALGLSSLTAGLCGQHYFYRGLVLHQIITNFINRRIFTHSLFLSQKSRLQSPTGDVVNHMSSDCDAVADIPIVMGDLSISILTIAGASVALFFLFGSTAFLSLLMMVLLVPITRRIALRFNHLEEELMNVRDSRITLMTQVLNGIRIVKYFVWEKSVRREVDVLRKRELESRWQLVRAESFASIGYIAISVMVLFITFAVHVWRGGVLTAASMFTAVALFQLLADPFSHLSQQISRVVHAIVGADRILKFLRRDSLTLPVGETSSEAPSIVIQDASVAFGGRKILDNFNIELRAGQSLAIVGGVGSGKSTLLQILLGEQNLASGKVSFLASDGEVIRPRLAYVPQEAFIINDTLRGNILFGNKTIFQEGLDRAIRLASLGRDIASLPAGLETEIGERGVNLSGGQKQRVSLARAILHDPSLVLLDDPLSAVDPRTELLLVHHLFFGAWKNITRVMVTHRLTHLKNFDRIAFLQNGKLVACGSFAELWEKLPDFRRFVSSHADQAPEMSLEEAPNIGRPASNWGSESDVEAMRRLTDAEERQVGAVSSSVYWDYILALGGKNRPRQNIFLLFFGVATVAFLPLLQRLWLARSADLQANRLNVPIHEIKFLDGLASGSLSSIYVYGLLGVIVIVAMLLNDMLWIRRGLVAGRNMHNDMLDSVLGARLRFFDSTPIGRVLQRFSRDVESIDVFLQAGFKQTVVVFAEVTVALILILSTLPLLLIVIAPVSYFYYRLQRDYRSPARESKRLDAISRSPRYAHFKETLQGLAVIRAFGKTDLFLETFYTYLAHSQRMFRAMYMLNRWFSSRIPVLGAAIAIATATGLLVAARSGHISTGLVGVTLVYLLNFWQLLNRGIRWFSELEARMTSVERLKFYASLEQEELVPLPDTKLAWPRAGAMSFNNVSIRYAAHLPEVLSGLSFTVPAGSRVGIIGRTGSGKSTLIQAVYRCMELSQGEIEIDGINIASLPLAQLRRSLAIIPQDPILFVGSLRSNIDRYSEYSDDVVWWALDQANLGPQVRRLPHGLETTVLENGLNFSQGQRQLLCLARALLSQAKVIIMDEATASVDVETDDLVQKVVRESCKGITMLIIAHRLATIADADLIIELERGKIKDLRSGVQPPPGAPWN